MYCQVMDWLGIDWVVVIQVNVYQYDNDCLLVCFDDMGDVVCGVVVILLDIIEVEIEVFLVVGVIGVWIMDLLGGVVGLD